MSQIPTKIVFAKRSILKNNHNFDNFTINLGLSSIFPLNSLGDIKLLNVINIFGGKGKTGKRDILSRNRTILCSILTTIVILTANYYILECNRRGRHQGG